MKRVIPYIIGLLLLCTPRIVLSQSFRLQQLQLNDPVLVRRLTSFIQLTKAKWLSISVRVDSINQSYTYYIVPIREYEPVKKYEGHFWGEWQHTMLLFNTPSDVAAIGRVVSTTDMISLRTCARLYLPREILVPVLGLKGCFEIQSRDTGRVFNEFKIVQGREVYFRSTDRDHTVESFVPDSLPPVPEHR